MVIRTGGTCHGYDYCRTGYACEKVVRNFKAIDIPETGTTLYNVSAGNYTINLSNVPSRYMNPGPIIVNVTESQDIQELKIVLEDMHDHVFSTEYKKDATNHWKECACGEKSGVEAHIFNGYKHNDRDHWGECNYGLRFQMLPHEFEWIVDKNATQQEAGSKHEECTYCHYSRPAVEIARLGIISPKTGDNTYQWIFLLAGISGMLVMGTLACRKKEK